MFVFLVQRFLHFYNSVQIQETVKQLAVIRNQLHVNRKNKNLVHQWVLLAIVIDRLLLIIFLVYSICTRYLMGYH